WGGGVRARRHIAFDSATPPLNDPRRIRAYDAAEAIPGGPYREVFDLDDVPPDSACAGFVVSTMTAHDGIIYAAGGRVDVGGIVVRPDPRICVFDTRTGAVLPPLTLEGFTGEIHGMSAIDQGRLIVLSGDPVSLPSPGYLPSGQSAPASGGPPDQLHVFDAATGARLDSRTIGTSQATGLACFPR